MESRIEASGFTVIIRDGELSSFSRDGYEFMHQAGSPGWGHSDIEMFPIIGPTADNNFVVQVPRGTAVQDQHGLLRELEYQEGKAQADSASFTKEYKAGTAVPNSKYPKSSARLLTWPYTFKFVKKFELSEKGLEITFTISGEKEMPYMLGYHPAFRIATSGGSVVAGDRRISLDEVLAVGSRALEIADCNSLVLDSGRKLKITTEGFRHFMLWTEVPNMLCVEPITFYPYSVSTELLHQGFDYLSEGEKRFRVLLEPQ